VEERTAELVEAQKELARSRRLKELGRLSASVAHELRRPLASLKLSLYNMRKKRQNPEIDRHLDNCDEKIFESEQIISNLLKSTNLREPKFTKIDLSSILSECIDDLRSHYKGRDVEMFQDLSGLHGITVEADPVQLKEVAYNIIQNSFDAVPEPTGKIRIEGFSADNAAGFRVKDNDKGIPREDIGKVTEPFYTTKHQGVGLGLSIAKEIIGLHGGTLEFESEAGVGTTVTVTVPRRRP
jgi:signal transduction histidine kinase